MPDNIRSSSNITAIEIDNTYCEVVELLYPEIKLHHLGFENFRRNKYDLIISNPSYDSNLLVNPENKDIANYCIHHYFVAKSMKLLKKDGVLTTVPSSFSLGNTIKHARSIIKK
ncbi:MAG: Eco57I restriction-modification methylase domain-containing protein [Gammaproteobacteria bacterium]|nr:Eco57I restriction-modification methylase domain-containing protein [Gammaproteobacteria bacterium]